MEIAMEIAPPVTCIDAETACKDTLEPMERNEHGKWRKRSEVLATAWALKD
jgi:hypothetical protein